MPATIWGLVDDRTGHTGQVLGVIAQLGVPYLLKRLEYSAFAGLPSMVLGASLMGLDKKQSAPIAAPFPPLVIAAGRRTVPVLRYIKKHSPSTRTIYLMWPEVREGIDLIAVPEHDKIGERKNVITTLAPLHAVTAEALTAAREAWAPQFAHLPRPHIAINIGGDTKQGHYSTADWSDLLRRALVLAGRGSLLITTSRRTPPAALEVFKPLLANVPHLLHQWDKDKDNPYLGLLACADGVIVTGDSLSMCAEACVADKPVFIYANAAVTPKKHQQLHAALYERSIARPLDEQASLDWQPSSPLDDTRRVATEIKRRFPEAFI